MILTSTFAVSARSYAFLKQEAAELGIGLSRLASNILESAGRLAEEDPATLAIPSTKLFVGAGADIELVVAISARSVTALYGVSAKQGIALELLISRIIAAAAMFDDPKADPPGDPSSRRPSIAERVAAAKRVERPGEFRRWRTMRDETMPGAEALTATERTAAMMGDPSHRGPSTLAIAAGRQTGFGA